MNHIGKQIVQKSNPNASFCQNYYQHIPRNKNIKKRERKEKSMRYRVYINSKNSVYLSKFQSIENRKVYRIEYFCFQRTLDKCGMLCVCVYSNLYWKLQLPSFSSNKNLCIGNEDTQKGRRLGWNDDEFPYLLTPQICSIFLYSWKKL